MPHIFFPSDEWDKKRKVAERMDELLSRIMELQKQAEINISEAMEVMKDTLWLIEENFVQSQRELVRLQQTYMRALGKGIRAFLLGFAKGLEGLAKAFKEELKEGDASACESSESVK